MDTRHIVRISAIAIVAALLLTLMVAVPAFAAESTTSAATTAVAAAATPKATEAAPAEGASGEAAKSGEKKEIPHVVGHPSTAQLEDLRRAWTSIPGFDLLLVSILGIVVTVGIIGFGAFKQMKV